MNPHSSSAIHTSAQPRSSIQTLLMGLGGSLACHAVVIGAIGYWFPVAPIDELDDRDIVQIERVNLDPEPAPTPAPSPVTATTPPPLVPKSTPIKINSPSKVSKPPPIFASKPSPQPTIASKPKPTPTKIAPPITASQAKPTPTKTTPPINVSKPKPTPPNRSISPSAPLLAKPLPGRIDSPSSSQSPAFPDLLFSEPTPTPSINQKPLPPQRQRREPRQVKIVRQVRRAHAMRPTSPVPNPRPTTQIESSPTSGDRNDNFLGNGGDLNSLGGGGRSRGLLGNGNGGDLNSIGNGNGGDPNSLGVGGSGNRGSHGNGNRDDRNSLGNSNDGNGGNGGIQCLQNCEIRYPDSIADAQTGKDKILVRVSIDANGTITQAEIVRSSGNPQLDPFVLEKIKQMRLKPLGKALTFKIKVNAFNNN